MAKIAVLAIVGTILSCSVVLAYHDAMLTFSPVRLLPAFALSGLLLCAPLKASVISVVPVSALALPHASGYGVCRVLAKKANDRWHLTINGRPLAFLVCDRVFGK